MKTITIIGGGLAGLILGIGLRQRGVPVKVFEAGRYPRHRVCGEFISGNGLQTLERLSLRKKLIDAGAVPAETAAFFSERKQRGLHILPKSALCLSRFKLDALLAAEFRRLGGELEEGARWAEKNLSEGFVRASGRRVQAVENGWRLFGLKVHARNVKLEADLEMHFRSDGYVGVCKLGEGNVNICGLLRSRTALPGLNENWKDVLKGEPDSVLHQRLGSAEFDETSFCFVAGISLKPKRASHFTEVVIGDTLTMIPPLTGNGMSMAFESAELALEPLRKYSVGAFSWNHARETMARSCDTLFESRLFWASTMQRMLIHPLARMALFQLFSHSQFVSEFFFSKTR
jgi:flavin-dependent dehydrogenase